VSQVQSIYSWHIEHKVMYILYGCHAVVLLNGMAVLYVQSGAT